MQGLNNGNIGDGINEIGVNNLGVGAKENIVCASWKGVQNLNKKIENASSNEERRDLIGKREVLVRTLKANDKAYF